MPTVWNKRDPQKPANAEYVGRPTLLGNPFSHLEKCLAEFKCKTVQEAITGFEAYARHRAEEQHLFKRAIKSLYNKDLVCWCAPMGGTDVFDTKLVCHAQVIGRLAKEFHDEALALEAKA